MRSRIRPNPVCRGGKHDPAFHTKPQLALMLVEQARAAGIAFKAVVADCLYGDHHAFETAMCQRRLPFVLAHRGTVGRGWAPEEMAHSFAEAWHSVRRGDWRRVTRRFRDGHVEPWWAVELAFLGYGPYQPVRAVCATTDRRALPTLSTCYLTTNLPVPTAPLAEVVRLYGLRHWIEQSYQKMKNELGWADFMVRSDRAIRRHWALVCCAFAFCWWHEAQEVRLHAAVTPARKKVRAMSMAVPIGPFTRYSLNSGPFAMFLPKSVLLKGWRTSKVPLSSARKIVPACPMSKLP